MITIGVTSQPKNAPLSFTAQLQRLSDLDGLELRMHLESALGSELLGVRASLPLLLNQQAVSLLAVLHDLIQIDQSLLERLAFALIGDHVGLATHREEPGRPARGLVDGAGRVVDMGVWLVDVSTLVAVELCVVSVGDSNGRMGVRIPMILFLRSSGVPWMTSISACLASALSLSMATCSV